MQTREIASREKFGELKKCRLSTRLCCIRCFAEYKWYHVFLAIKQNITSAMIAKMLEREIDVGFVYLSEISLKRLATFREYMFNSPKKGAGYECKCKKISFYT